MKTSDARERFSDAYDGELSDDTLRDFRAALSADPGLATEYKAFSDLLTHAADRLPVGDAPDLMRGIQKRLRGSTRLRFFGDRFAGAFGRGGISPMLLAMCVVALIALLWLALNLFQKLEGEPGHSLRNAGSCERFHDCKATTFTFASRATAGATSDDVLCVTSDLPELARLSHSTALKTTNCR